jgi:hypothetical protein
MTAEPRQDPPGRKSQLWWILTSMVALIVIASRAWWFYDNFLKHDEPPIEVGDDAFGTGQMVDMYADAKVAPRQFNETYGASRLPPTEHSIMRSRITFGTRSRYWSMRILSPAEPAMSPPSRWQSS